MIFGKVLLTFDPACRDDLKTVMKIIKDYARTNDCGNLVLSAPDGIPDDDDE